MVQLHPYGTCLVYIDSSLGNIFEIVPEQNFQGHKNSLQLMFLLYTLTALLSYIFSGLFLAKSA